MPHTLSDLLKVSAEHDAKIHARHVKINKAMQTAGEHDVTVGVPVHELTLMLEDEDPFNGNLNNRRVAARIARDGERISANHSHPVVMGNAEKARADVEKSLAVFPDPAIPNPDEELAADAPAPTPGSPAAKKAAKAAAKAAKGTQAAPQTWGQ